MRKKMPFFQVGNQVLIGVCLLLVIACRKDTSIEPTLPSPACLITKKERVGFFSTYQYDQNKRLITIQEHYDSSQYQREEDRSATLLRDANNRVTRIEYDRGRGLGIIFTFDYDAKGRWIKTTFTNTPATDHNYTIVADYNSQGLVAKTVRNITNGSFSYTVSYTFEYTDNNLSKSTRTEGNYVAISLYEYDLDQVAQWNEIDLLQSYIIGSNSLTKNRVKKVTSPAQYPGQSTGVTQFFYEYNPKGYVTKEGTQTSYDGGSASTLVTDYTYQCN